MKRLIVFVRGEQKSWSFEFFGDPAHIEDWRKDGLDVWTVENTVPVWVANIGAVRLWCVLQDIFNFRNPWRKS